MLMIRKSNFWRWGGGFKISIWGISVMFEFNVYLLNKLQSSHQRRGRDVEMVVQVAGKMAEAEKIRQRTGQIACQPALCSTEGHL